MVTACDDINGVLKQLVGGIGDKLGLKVYALKNGLSPYLMSEDPKALGVLGKLKLAGLFDDKILSKPEQDQALENLAQLVQKNQTNVGDISKWGVEDLTKFCDNINTLFGKRVFAPQSSRSAKEKFKAWHKKR